MTLDEALVSNISDPVLATEISKVMYGKDNRPAWIGAHRPFTTMESLNGACLWASIHYDFYLNFVREYMTHKGSILDIGSGAGQNTAMLLRYANEVIGLEPDKLAYEFAVKYNPGPKYIRGLFPGKDAGERFDYIFLVETIEHIAHDKQADFLGCAMHLLTDDGLLFITTPNEETSAAPHIGIWSPGWMAKLAEQFKDHIKRNAYFHNKCPEKGFSENPKCSHRALVMGK